MEKEGLLHWMGVVKSGLCLHSGHLALDKGGKWQGIFFSTEIPECLNAHFGQLSLLALH